MGTHAVGLRSKVPSNLSKYQDLHVVITKINKKLKNYFCIFLIQIPSISLRLRPYATSEVWNEQFWMMPSRLASVATRQQQLYAAWQCHYFLIKYKGHFISKTVLWNTLSHFCSVFYMRVVKHELSKLLCY